MDELKNDIISIKLKRNLILNEIFSEIKNVEEVISSNLKLFITDLTAHFEIEETENIHESERIHVALTELQKSIVNFERIKRVVEEFQSSARSSIYPYTSVDHTIVNSNTGTPNGDKKRKHQDIDSSFHNDGPKNLSRELKE